MSIVLTTPHGTTGPQAAAQRGWHVFPVRRRGKWPAVPDHDTGHCTGRDPWCRGGHQGWEPRATTDPARIRRAWAQAPYNAGIACGPSRLVVIDLDTHGPLPVEWHLPGIRDGRDVFAQLCEWAGQAWPATYTVRTPLDGWHLYYRAPAGQDIGNSAGKIGPRIDVRGGGGYVLAAGSVVDERAYPNDPAAAAAVKGGRAYEVIDGSGPVPLPGWLARVLAPPPRPGRRPPRVPAATGARLAGLVATVAAGKRGDRNGPLYWASCRAAEMIAAGEIGQQDAEETLVTAALTAGLRGGEHEARRTFASAMRGGAQ